MHLVYLAIKNVPPPAVLPPSLIPASKQAPKSSILPGLFKMNNSNVTFFNVF